MVDLHHFVPHSAMPLIPLTKKMIKIIVESQTLQKVQEAVLDVKLLMDGNVQIQTMIKLKIHVNLNVVMALRLMSRLKMKVTVLFHLIQQKIQMVVNNVNNNQDMIVKLTKMVKPIHVPLFVLMDLKLLMRRRILIIVL